MVGTDASNNPGGEATGQRGGLLAGPALTEALGTPNRIFRDGSWALSQVKGAGYELRLADDLLVIPSQPGGDTYRTVRSGEPGIGEFTLNPGDSALVSTQEKFCLDFDISVLIGPKFRWSARGLLVLHGMVAHPGYGRIKTPSGEWIPKDDERLYVVLANVGPSPIYMRKGDPVAYVQFFEVQRPKELRQIDNFGFDYLRETLFGLQDPQSPGLAYFRNIRDLKKSVSALEASVDQEVKLVNSRIEGMQIAIDRVRNVTDNVVVFGVFLVGATILGIVLTTLIELIRDTPSHLGWPREALIVGLSVVYALAAVAGVALVGASVRRRRPDAATSLPRKDHTSAGSEHLPAGSYAVSEDPAEDD